MECYRYAPRCSFTNFCKMRQQQLPPQNNSCHQKSKARRDILFRIFTDADILITLTVHQGIISMTRVICTKTDND